MVSGSDWWRTGDFLTDEQKARDGFWWSGFWAAFAFVFGGATLYKILIHLDVSIQWTP